MKSFWEEFLEFKHEVLSLMATGQWIKFRERLEEYQLWHSKAYRFERYISSSNELLEEIQSQCQSNKKNIEKQHVKSLGYLKGVIYGMLIRNILTPPDESDLNSRLLKLKELSDRVEFLKIESESNDEFSRGDKRVSVACEHFQNRLQETISLIECEIRGYFISDLTAEWYDPYACNVYEKVNFILDDIEDGELKDTYIFRYILTKTRMMNYDTDPDGIRDLQLCLFSVEQFNFGRYLTAESSNIMKSGITECNLLMFKMKIEITSVHYLKSLLKYDEEQLLNNEEKLNKVIDTFLFEFNLIRDHEKCISNHDIKYIFYFIELFIRVVNCVAAYSNTERNLLEWFKKLQFKVKELLKVVNLIKFSELTIPETINLHVITRIVQLLSILIKYRRLYILDLEGPNDEVYFENCNKLLVKIAWQLYKDERSTKKHNCFLIKFIEFVEDNETEVEYKSKVVKLPDQPRIDVNKISLEFGNFWLEKLHDLDIEAVKKEPCLVCCETYSEDTDLVLLPCSDVICFKCAHHWFRLCNLKENYYHCMFCNVTVDGYVQLSKLDQIKKELSENGCCGDQDFYNFVYDSD